MRRTTQKEIDGRSINVVEMGNLSGTAVFGFQGTPATHRQFLAFDEPAEDLGIRLVVPDRPGYGASMALGFTFLKWLTFKVLQENERRKKENES